MPAPYVVDASIWIRIWRNHPPDIFVSLWEKLDAAVAAGDLVSPDEVLQELQRGEDTLAEVLRSRTRLFLPLDDAQMLAVADVVQKCHGLVNEEAERGRADPFVVALARVRHGTVVSGERPRRTATSPFKIPDACSQYGIPCIDWFQFLREMGWQM